jgi:hypothetical protein
MAVCRIHQDLSWCYIEMPTEGAFNPVPVRPTNEAHIETDYKRFFQAILHIEHPDIYIVMNGLGPVTGIPFPKSHHARSRWGIHTKAVESCLHGRILLKISASAPLFSHPLRNFYPEKVQNLIQHPKRDSR